MTAISGCGSSFGAGCDRWKKFHFRGDFGRFSSFFGFVSCPLPALPRSPLISLCGCSDSSDMTLASRLVMDGETPTSGTLRGFGIGSGPDALLNRCTDLRKTNDDPLPIPSSLLSDGRRPLGIASVEALLDESFGSAEGQSVVRLTSWLRLDLLGEPLESRLGRSNRKLVLLSLRISSELVFRFSMISPPPAMMTGLIRSRRNGS